MMCGARCPTRRADEPATLRDRKGHPTHLPRACSTEGRQRTSPGRECRQDRLYGAPLGSDWRKRGSEAICSVGDEQGVIIKGESRARGERLPCGHPLPFSQVVERKFMVGWERGLAASRLAKWLIRAERADHERFVVCAFFVVVDYESFFM